MELKQYIKKSKDLFFLEDVSKEDLIAQTREYIDADDDILSNAIDTVLQQEEIQPDELSSDLKKYLQQIEDITKSGNENTEESLDMEDENDGDPDDVLDDILQGKDETGEADEFLDQAADLHYQYHGKPKVFGYGESKFNNYFNFYNESGEPNQIVFAEEKDVNKNYGYLDNKIKQIGRNFEKIKNEQGSRLGIQIEKFIKSFIPTAHVEHNIFYDIIIGDTYYSVKFLRDTKLRGINAVFYNSFPRAMSKDLKNIFKTKEDKSFGVIVFNINNLDSIIKDDNTNINIDIYVSKTHTGEEVINNFHNFKGKDTRGFFKGLFNLTNKTKEYILTPPEEYKREIVGNLLGKFVSQIRGTTFTAQTQEDLKEELKKMIDAIEIKQEETN